MVIVLVVLLVLSLGGISVINRSVTESYIVRNSGFQKQNLQLAEMAALEGLREILRIRDAANLKPGAKQWIWCTNDWNDAARGKIPDSGYAVPRTVSEKTINTMKQRGETDKGTLRYYFAGWEDAKNESISMRTTAKWRTGIITGVYDSPRHGRAWVEIGVLKKF